MQVTDSIWSGAQITALQGEGEEVIEFSVYKLHASRTQHNPHLPCFLTLHFPTETHCDLSQNSFSAEAVLASINTSEV